VAPQFETIDDFNSAFLDRNLTEQSRILPLTDCDDCNDDVQHYITFQEGQDNWKQHSTPKHKTRSYNGHAIGRLYHDSKVKWQKIDKNFAEAALNRTTEAIKRTLAWEKGANKYAAERVLPLLDDRKFPRSRASYFLRTAEVLSVFVGATMVLVGEVPK
jgi:hypothetical protein